MEWIKLIGILIILVGFIFKFDTIAVVIVAALSTALVSGMSFYEFFSMLGEAFVNNRLVTIFLLTLPMIGLSERFGLRQQAVILIKKIKGLTPGKFITLYTALRELAGLFGLRLSGHPQFVRPIVNPMAQASAEHAYGDISKEDEDKIKAKAAASENFGNFFAQNTFIASAGVLLIYGTLKDLGYEVTDASIARMALLVAVIALVLSAISNWLFDKKLAKKYNKMKGVDK
ncbi:DUF969 domain-containing protein [Vagococcus teuberi]